MSENQNTNTSQPTAETQAAIIGELVKRLNEQEKVLKMLVNAGASQIESIKCCKHVDSKISEHIGKADQAMRCAADFIWPGMSIDEMGAELIRFCEENEIEAAEETETDAA